MDHLKTLLVTVEDRIAVVTLNRPPVNAQNAELRKLLNTIDTVVIDDANVRGPTERPPSPRAPTDE